MQQWARTTGIEVRHELLGAAEGAKGHAAPDVFSKGREIRRYADLALPAARAKAGGHHLIENQQDAVLAAFLAEHRKEIAGSRDRARRAHHRLDDHAGQLVLMAFDQRTRGIDIVISAENPLERHVERAR